MIEKRLLWSSKLARTVRGHLDPLRASDDARRKRTSPSAPGRRAAVRCKAGILGSKSSECAVPNILNASAAVMTVPAPPPSMNKENDPHRRRPRQVIITEYCKACDPGKRTPKLTNLPSATGNGAETPNSILAASFGAKLGLHPARDKVAARAAASMRGSGRSTMIVGSGGKRAGAAAELLEARRSARGPSTVSVPRSSGRRRSAIPGR